MKISEHVRARLEDEAKLKALTERYATESKILRDSIASHRKAESVGRAGLNLEQVALAESVIYVRGLYSNSGEGGPSALNDAINDLATERGASMRSGYFGTKGYAHWLGQREDCRYGYGPKHGSIVFEIGLVPEARRRELTDEEIEAAIYYLMNLSVIQQAQKEVRAA